MAGITRRASVIANGKAGVKWKDESGSKARGKLIPNYIKIMTTPDAREREMWARSNIFRGKAGIPSS